MKSSEIRLPSNKKFGLLFTVVFALLMVKYYLEHANVFLCYTSGALAVLFGLITIIKPTILEPLNRAWMLLGYILGKVVSPVVLGVIFFLIFVPIAIIKKLLKVDDLHIKMNHLQSFWINRDVNNYSSESFKNQY